MRKIVVPLNTEEQREFVVNLNLNNVTTFIYREFCPLFVVIHQIYSVFDFEGLLKDDFSCEIGCAILG